MRTLAWITFYSGLFIGVGPLIGSATRLASRIFGPRYRALSEAIVAPLWAGVAYLAIDYLAPGTTAFRNASAVGFLSSQVLTVWESVALWSGLAVAIGTMVPLFPRPHRGSSGVAPVTGLLLVFSPGTLIGAFGVWFLSLSITNSPRLALAFTFGAVAVSEWLLSLAEARSLWGVIHGPESTLWVTVFAGALLARWSHGDRATLG